MQIQSTGYSIYYGDAVFAQLQAYIEAYYANSNIVVLVDDNTFELCMPVIAGFIEAVASAEVIEIPSGEGNKNLTNIAHIWDTLTGLGVDRQTLLINLGGGLVSDMGGFAATTFKRGIDYINIPTTLLAMVDASVGGKTGFDFNSLKNQIGLFTNPKAVFIEPAFLDTLPERELYAGFAEMLKHALVADATLWEQLKYINPKNHAELVELIPRSVQIKNTIVQADPYDMGERRKLNFGHTFGHAIESNYIGRDEELLHGEAVAVGMVCEAFISLEKGLISPTVLKEVEEYIAGMFTFPAIDADDEQGIVSLMLHDKKNSQNTINASLLTGIGACAINIPVSIDEIKKALHYCKALSY